MVGHHSFLNDDDEHLETAAERRIALAEDKRNVRLALKSIARYGYYVFDEIITECVGSLDYLTVGPPGAICVIVRFDQGCVSSGDEQNKLLLDGKPFDDDPFRQGAELVEEISCNLFGTVGEVNGIVCFPRADFVLDEDRRPPPNTTPVWELSWALDPEGQEEQFTPADIEEIAEKVQRVYGRPPIVTPNRDRLWEEGF